MYIYSNLTIEIEKCTTISFEAQLSSISMINEFCLKKKQVYPCMFGLQYHLFQYLKIKLVELCATMPEKGQNINNFSDLH